MTDSRVAARSFYTGKGHSIKWYYPGDRVPMEIAKTLPDIMWVPQGQDPEEAKRDAAARASANKAREAEVAKELAKVDDTGHEEEESFEVDEDFMSLTIAELRTLAKENEIDIEGVVKKRDLARVVSEAIG